MGSQTAADPGGARPSVQSRFYTPPPQFDGCFTTFYHLELDIEGSEETDGAAPEVEDYLQPEWANIRFFGGARPSSEIGSSQLSGARFIATGPSSLPCHFSLGPSRMWGVGFLPLGWARFVDADASDFANTILDGAAHPVFARFDSMSETLCDPSIPMDQQLDLITSVMEGLMQPSRDEAKITRVHAALVSGEHVAVGDLAKACAMSIRTLERVCHRYFGFTPKLLMRRQRFMRSLTNFMLKEASKRAGRWTEAMDEEYHDQAQFTREFTEFMTMTPSKYASLDHPILSSFMEARARVWGSAAQTLDQPAQDED
ncbi:MAG: helix-turn-helix domain-containing protein [Pseudomonadota bacterium]